MSANLSLTERLRVVFVPTSTQLLAVFVLSLGLLLFSQSESLLSALGVTPVAIEATENQFRDRFGAILRSYAVSQMALVTFWATIGLIAYLICWGVYNVLIEARNEVTLSTSYANRGHWRSPHHTLGLKALGALFLFLAFGSLEYGLSFWLTLSSQVLSDQSPMAIAGAIGAIFGPAFELYLIVVGIQLTFTPWYSLESSAQTFTQD